MSVRRARRSVATHTTNALLLRKVPHGDAHVIATFLTEDLGRVSALARNAATSRRRFGGNLESLHTLRITTDEPADSELLTLTEAVILLPRTRLLGDLGALEAAGLGLLWAGRVAPPRQPEPGVWAALTKLLDELDAPEAPSAPRVLLAQAGLELLDALGWGIELERCVGCGKPCAPERPALLDAKRGGIVCRACGGARQYLDATRRQRLLRARAGEPNALRVDDAGLVIDLVQQSLDAHAGVKM